MRSLYQPGKLGNAFKEANSTQQYPTVPNSTPPGLAEVFVLLCRYTFSRLAAHRPWQHTGPGSTHALATHKPWQHGSLAAHRPWHWSCILSPAWQHTGRGTGVVYFPRLEAHRPWHWSCILSPPGSTQALALELYTFPRLAAHRPRHWSCILSPSWQHTGRGTGVVYFPPPGSTQALALELYTFPRLAAHRPWHCSCKLPSRLGCKALVEDGNLVDVESLGDPLHSHVQWTSWLYPY